MLRSAESVSTSKPSRVRRPMLASVTTGMQSRPVRAVLYGPEGIGKSTFAAHAPSPIFLGSEEGTSQLDVARLPEPRYWQEVNDAIEDLTNEQHQYKTLVIDTLDWLEPVLWDHLCKESSKESIEDFGYGKGYSVALDAWRALLARIDALRLKRGMHVIALAHTWIRKFQNPDGEDFDRYELKINNKAAGLWKEWSDAVLFAQYETFTRETRTGKVRAVSTGARVVHTNRTAAWDAKSRYPIPEQIALDWGEFWAAIEKGEPLSAEKLLEQIGTMLAGVDDAIQARVNNAIKAANGNAAQLSRIANKLSAIVNGAS
jgi:hypothetical protein